MNRHVPLPQQPLPLSGLAALEFAWQRFNEIAHELPLLLTEHLREVSSVEISPDWDRYYAWDVNGMLRILTVRDRGTLVGYLFLLLSPHIDSKTTLRAHAEKFWLDPLYRQGWTGVKLFKEAIRAAAEWGAKELSVPVELHIMDGRLENLLKRLGFRPVETIFARRLP